MGTKPDIGTVFTVKIIIIITDSKPGINIKSVSGKAIF